MDIPRVQKAGGMTKMNERKNPKKNIFKKLGGDRHNNIRVGRKQNTNDRPKKKKTIFSLAGVPNFSCYLLFSFFFIE